MGSGTSRTPRAPLRAAGWARRSGTGWVGPESVFEDARPDCFVSVVGCETVRTAAQRVARSRGVPTLYFLYTIFPRPLRIYVDEPYGPIVPAGEVRALSPEEREEYEQFRREFTARAEPIRAPRRQRLAAAALERSRKLAAAGPTWRELVLETSNTLRDGAASA